MVKWRLMLTTTPFVAVVLLIKLVLDAVGYPGVVEFGDVGLVLTGGVFLIGFMLAGVMADFKESEKIPGEMAATLEAIEDAMAQAIAAKPELAGAGLRASLLSLTEALLQWFNRKRTHPEMFEALHALVDLAPALDRAGASAQSGRLLGELHNLRKLVTRAGVISRTGFLASGYALLDTLTTLIIGLLFISRFKSFLAEVILCGTVTLIYVYMVRLIRDADDPFEYSDDGAKGAAEVELFPLEEYRDRLRARATPPPRSAG